METPIHECSRSGNNDILIALLESIPPSKLQLTVNKRSSVSSSNYFSPNCEVYLPFQSVFEFHDMWFLLSLVGLRKNSDYVALKILLGSRYSRESLTPLPLSVLPSSSPNIELFSPLSGEGGRLQHKVIMLPGLNTFTFNMMATFKI